MTKDELIKTLNAIEGNPEIFIDERMTDFRFGLLNGVVHREINMMEEPQGEILSKEWVIVLSEA